MSVASQSPTQRCTGRAGKIPGVVVVDHAKDAAGREGIALAHVDQQNGYRTEWIFDRKTYAYLGSRDLQVKQVGAIKPGTVLECTAVPERAVVDAQKQRPGAQGADACERDRPGPDVCSGNRARGSPGTGGCRRPGLASR